MNFYLSDLANYSNQIINQGLTNLGPGTLLIVFLSGLLTSLGPCSLSLLPITVAYLAGFHENQSPLQKSISFCSGIVLALVILGMLSGLIGSIYGQVPSFFPSLVAIIAILMGLNLIGLIKLPLPQGPDPNSWQNKVPRPLAPVAAGLAFGLAASPCTTPVLAVLLAWIAQNGNPLTGIALLGFFGIGQITPLFLAGSVAASVPKLLAIRPISKWIPPLSGVILISAGTLSLLSRWI